MPFGPDVINEMEALAESKDSGGWSAVKGEKDISQSLNYRELATNLVQGTHPMLSS